MKRSLITLALILALALPVSARPLTARQHQHRSPWVTLWNGFVHAIGGPYRLFDDPAPDTGTHVIPIIAPTPAPGS